MKILLTALVMGGAFFISGQAFSANTDIVISEIGAYEAGGHEWVEIWNKGSEPANLTGWKFWENNTNHGLSVSTTDAIVSAGEYAVIVQDAAQFILDYPNFVGSIFDSSWGGLNESGEEIGLKDAEGNFVEKFVYIAAPNFSLQRRDANLADYTSANWAEHASGNTVGVTNNFDAPITQATTSTQVVLPAAPSSGGSSANNVIIESPAPDLLGVKINEFVSDPETGNEWVELYNTSLNSLDLTGALICDNRNTTSTCKKLFGTVSARGWFVFDLGSRSFLNNSGDSVILKDARGVAIDRIDYVDDLAPDEGQSLARATDGADTDSENDWIVTDKITPGSANIAEEPVQASNTAANLISSSTIIVAPEQAFPAEIIISEILPNPKGDDSGEFMEIKNNSTVSANLSGWFFSAKEKKYIFPEDTVIFPGSFLVFYKPATKISLLNTGGKIELFNKNKNVVDLVSYEKPPEGKSYGLVSGEWEWANPTPGKENTSAGLVLAPNNDGKNSTVKLSKFVNSTVAARQAGKGAWASVKGVVTVLPGVFGSQYFYLTDGSSGIQIYQNKKDFPELFLGDLVQAQGTVSEANGIKRINIKSKNSLDILAVEQFVTSTILDLDEIDESMAGGLVKFEGEITEIKSNFMYMDNGIGEIAIYFKQGAKINKSKFREGENARVTGILEQTKNGWQIWPRSNDDLESLGPSADLLKKQTADNGGDATEKYLTATAGGVTTLILAFLARARGLVVVGGIKKVAGLAGKLIKKG